MRTVEDGNTTPVEDIAVIGKMRTFKEIPAIGKTRTLEEIPRISKMTKTRWECPSFDEETRPLVQRTTLYMAWSVSGGRPRLARDCTFRFPNGC